MSPYSFPNIPDELKNLSAHHAQLAYRQMNAADQALQETNPVLWRERYQSACLRVIRGEPSPHQLSLPFERQA